MRFAILLLATSACAAPPAVLEGDHGFEVTRAIGLVCPPDFQGQFMKVFIEGASPSSECDMDLYRAIPNTCEDRQAYLDAVPGVCLGQSAAPGEYLPMLDYLLEEEEGGEWVDFDYVPLVSCFEGKEKWFDLFGNTTVTRLADDRLELDFDLTDQYEQRQLLAGTVEVEICPERGSE